MKFMNKEDAIQFIKENHATQVGMRINNKTSSDGFIIGCIGVIGTIHTQDGEEIRFQIGDNQCSIERNTAEQMIRDIRSSIQI